MLEFRHAVELAQFAAKPAYSWKARMDVVVWIVGFASTLVLGALDGILSASALSLFIIVFQVVDPTTTLTPPQT